MSQHLNRLILFSISLFLSLVGWSQTVPDSISYQAVIRDLSGAEVVNSAVTIEFAVRADSPEGTIFYEENHDLVPTNQYGMFVTMIGNGTNTGNGQFNSLSEIPWQQHTYFLEVRAAVPGEGSTQVIGVSQLVTVPYAFYADKAGSVLNEGDGDSTNELIDDFSLDENVLTISENDIEYSVDLSSVGGDDADADPQNELISDISLSPENQLQVTEGDAVVTADLSALAYATWQENGNAVYNETQNVGIGTSTPSSTLDVDGSLALGITMLNGETYNLGADNANAATTVFLCDVTSQDVTITLVSAASCPGRMYKFRKLYTGVVTSNDVNIFPVSGESIDGMDVYEMTNIYAEYLTIISTGNTWFVINHSKE